MTNLRRINYYMILAEYFSCRHLYLDESSINRPNVRKLVELPWQQTKAEMWDEVTETLCSLEFIQAKAAARMTYELVDDFNLVLQTISDNSKNIQEELARLARLDKYAKDLVHYARGEIKDLDIPESIKPWTEEQINSVIERISNRPTRLDRINCFYQFLGQEAGILQEHAHELPGLAIQQAWNDYDDGPVGKAATCIISKMPDNLLLHPLSNRTSWSPSPSIVKTLIGHTLDIMSVSFIGDYREAITCSPIDGCFIWDLRNGQYRKVLLEDDPSINEMSVSAEGKYAISISLLNKVIFWDLVNGQSLRILEGQSDKYSAVAITPDAKLVITGSEDSKCILWDIESGQQMKVLTGHTAEISAVCITPDGRLALSGSADKTIILWDLDRGQPKKILKGHKDGIGSLCITPNGKYAISSSFDKCIIWDLNRGLSRIILYDENGPCDHINGVKAVAITPDGKYAFTAARTDCACFLWDIEKGLIVKSLTGHTLSIRKVDISPDGKWGISASEDNTCILWDLERGHTENLSKSEKKSLDGLSFTPDGTKLISLSYGGIQLWDMKNFQPDKKSKLPGATTPIAFTPDGKKLIAGSVTNNPFSLYDFEKDQPIKVKRKVSRGVTNIILVTPDGQNVLIFTSDAFKEYIRIWHLKKKIRKKTFVIKDKRIKSILITPDWKVAILNSFQDISAWDLQRWQPLEIFKGLNKSSKVFSELTKLLAISPDGKIAILLIPGFYYDLPNSEILIILDLNSGIELKSFVLAEHSFQSAFFAPDGNFIYSKSNSTNLAIWDINRGRKVSQYFAKENFDIITSNKDVIILGSWNGNLHILQKPEVINKTCIVIATVFRCRLSGSSKILFAYCPVCGKGFKPTGTVLDCIENITIKSGLKPDQSPCLHLPHEAWDEPNLMGNCSFCGGKIKFNPFIAENLIYNPWWKFWKNKNLNLI